MAASVLVPILANGVRAWGTIYIAHLTTPEFAAGFDHIVYGWIFFALRDRAGPGARLALLRPPASTIRRSIPAKLQSSEARPSPIRTLAEAGVVALVLAAAAPAYAAFAAAARTASCRPPAWRCRRRGLGTAAVRRRAVAAALQGRRPPRRWRPFIDGAGQPGRALPSRCSTANAEGASCVGYQRGRRSRRPPRRAGLVVGRRPPVTAERPRRADHFRPGRCAMSGSFYRVERQARPAARYAAKLEGDEGAPARRPTAGGDGA